VLASATSAVVQATSRCGWAWVGHPWVQWRERERLIDRAIPRDEHPDDLEAKVVADADLLEKFGAFGVYQTIRSHGEFDWPLARILEFMLAGKGSALTLETDTGRRLAEPGRRFVLDFYRELARAAEPYGDSSL